MTSLDLVDEGAVAASETQRLGRNSDHARDPQILQATIDVLAETGYDGMTIDLVAARARAGKATLYRRWPSKAELVIDADLAAAPRISREHPRQLSPCAALCSAAQGDNCRM